MNRVTVLLATFLGILLVNAEFQKHVLTRSIDKLSADQDADWWKTAVIYQLYPRSFRDSNNDGNGDLQGVIQKLDYLKEMGVNAIWLNPIFKSPQIDTGYDIADYRDIDPIYGTIDDLRQLVDEAHNLNIKILLDYVPNHTSDKHDWFQASIKRDPTYDDYYIWQNATYVDGERSPPNNWISCFNGPAWEWNEDRQQYYFHQFSTGQVDLNYRNPVVVEEMKNVLRFWLDFGVDGFRIDAVSTLFEDVLLRDEPESGTPGLGPNDHEFLKHIYTLDQPEVFDMIYQWRAVLDEYNTPNVSNTRIMITEGNADPNAIPLFYGNGTVLGAHFTFNFITFLGLHMNFTSKDLYNGIKTWWDILPSGYTDNWLLGNHDNSRVSTRLGVKHIDGLNMLISILQDAQMTYQGEEIGQENGNVTCEEGTDPQAITNCSTFDTRSRDFERTPFQWDNSTNAGFNDGAKPWLPVSEKYVETNLASQNISDINSHYNIYKQMLKVRQQFKKPGLDKTVVAYGVNSSILFAQRAVSASNYSANYAFYYNVGDSEDVISFWPCEDCMTVAIRSINSDYNPGDKFNLSQPLKPGEAILSEIADDN